MSADEMPAPTNDDWRPHIFGQEDRIPVAK